MRDFLAIITVKFLVKVMNLLGYKGGTLPGRIGLIISPNVLKHLHYPKDIIFITGTNGKTSVTNMVCNVFDQQGFKILGNRLGDNLEWGITTSLLLGSTMSGRVRADIVCLEVDELTGIKLMESIQPTVLLVNNFFRDQLDRVGEMDTLISLYENVVRNFEGCVILNANDPNVTRLALHDTKARLKFYGMEANDSILSTTQEFGEGQRCPKCGSSLHYSARFYSHVGIFDCPNKDFKTFKYDIQAEKINLENATFVVNGVEYSIMYDMLYSVLNQSAVIALASEFNVSSDVIQNAFKSFYVNNGRMESLRLNEDYECLLNLIKNPAGASEIIKFVSKQPEEKAVLCLLNDNDADGNDISWIWDAPFDRLVQPQTHVIICSGNRAYDMALRFKYSNYPTDKIIVLEDKAEAVLKLKEYSMKSYILSNYTALQPTRKELKKIAYEM